MPQLIRWYDAFDSALSAAIPLEGSRGLPSDPVTVRIRNEGGDPARSPRLMGEFLAPAPQRFGNQWMDRGWVEARITQGLDGLVASAGSWRSIGAGSWLPLPDLPPATGVEVEVRLNVTADGPTVSASIGLAVDSGLAAAVGAGVLEVAGAGIYLGLHDGGFDALAVGGDVLPDPGGPSANVLIPYLAGVIGGRAVGHTSELFALDDSDGDAATLASGESYWVALALGVSGVVVAKSAKGVTLTDADRPAMPAGLPLAFVLRDFDATIDSSQIFNAWTRDLFGFDASARVASLGPGVALVDHMLVESTAADPATLDASATSELWLLQDGSVGASTDGIPPSVAALKLWEATTDGSSVTGFSDRRHFVGFQPAELVFAWDGILTASSRYTHVPPGRGAMILPVGGVSLSLGVQCLTGTAGATAADLEYWDGAAWVSIYGASGDRPSIAHGATDLTAAGRPATLTLPPNARLRATISLPTAATAPDSATLVVRLAF